MFPFFLLLAKVLKKTSVKLSAHKIKYYLEKFYTESRTPISQKARYEHKILQHDPLGKTLICKTELLGLSFTLRNLVK